MATKVLWLIKGLGMGGAERLLTLAARYVDRTRFAYEAAFLLPWKTALVADLEQAGVRTTCLNHAYLLDMRIILRLAAFLKDRRVDILHLHLPYSGIIGRIAARLAGVPCVIYTEHGLQERCHPVTRALNQLTLGLCDLTIAVSDEVRASLLRSPLSRRARVVTIQNGIDVDGVGEDRAQAPSVRSEFSIPTDRLIVGAVSSFRPQKQLDLWIRAARAIADAEPRSVFMMVGDGPSRSRMQALAGALGLDGRLIFTGLRRDAGRLISAFDLFMTSSIHEGLPLSVLEAMALGRPIVATRVGGLPGVIRHGREGFLVSPGDPDALAAQALSLLKDPSLRRAMGEAAQVRVREQYSIRRMVRATEQLYTELLQEKAPERGRLVERSVP